MVSDKILESYGLKHKPIENKEEANKSYLEIKKIIGKYNEEGPIFDNREPKKLFDEIETQEEEYTIDQLHIGDCILSLDAALEIKRVEKQQNPVLDKDNNFQYDDEGELITANNNDLRASLFDGRLYRQSKARSENFKWNGMIIKIEPGSQFFDDHFTSMHFEAILTTLTTKFNTYVYIVESEEQLVRMIYKIYAALQTGEYYVSPINKTPKPSKTELFDSQMYFISSLIGIGEKSKILLDLFEKPEIILKWLLETKIEYTKGKGTPKFAKDAVRVKGFGPKFFIENQKMLQSVDYERKKKIAENNQSKE